MSNAWELVSERPGGTISSLVVGDGGALALSTAAVHRSSDAGATWSTLTAGRLAAPLNAVGQNGGSIFVAGQSGLARSRDLGRSWTPVLTGESVLCLGVTPEAHQRTLLAGTQADGLLRSEDDGDTWASANPGLFDLTVLSVAATPTGVSFAGTPTGLYRSTNAGRSWREVSLPCGPVGVECLAASDALTLAGTDAAGTFASFDAGRTWSPVAGLAESAATAATIGRDGSLLAVGSPSGVSVSYDRGHTWSFEAVGCVLSLACVAEGLLAGLAGDGILRLNLASGRWQPSSTGLNGRLIVHFGWSSQAEALLTADLEDGVRRSIDGGRTWDMVDCAPHAASRVAFAGGVVYAATTTGLYATDDDGLTWTAVYAEAGACAVATAPTGPALAAFENAQVVLFDGGQRRCLDWDASRGRIVAVAISDAENLFIGTLGEHSILWRSADAGRSWAAWLRTDRAESMCLAVSPDFAMDEQVLVGLETRVYRPLRHTRERTRSAVRPLWSATSLRESVTSLAFGQRPSIVYAATSHGVQRSIDGAGHFSAWSEGLPADVPVLAVQRTSHGVYALRFGGTLWRRSCQAPDA